MTNKEASRKLYALYRKLKQEDIRVALTRRLPKNTKGQKWFGMCEFGGECFNISLNPARPWRSRGGFVHTVLHEMIHIAWWDMSEKDVNKLEKDMFNALTDRQLTNFIKRVFRVARRDK